MGMFYIMPLMLYMVYRDTSSLSQSLTDMTLLQKSDLSLRDSLRFFTSWFTSPYRSPLGETLPRNPYALYQSSTFLIITAFLPFLLLIVGVFRSYA
jgi:hypothetical protein